MKPTAYVRQTKDGVVGEREALTALYVVPLEGAGAVAVVAREVEAVEHKEAMVVRATQLKDAAVALAKRAARAEYAQPGTAWVARAGADRLEQLVGRERQ